MATTQGMLFDDSSDAVLEVTGRRLPRGKGRFTYGKVPTADDIAARRARDEKLATATSRLESGIRDLATEPAWIAWLRAQAKFHDYSFNNTMLIALQFPTATRVAGYAKWKELGRWVRKGEKGITILAPIVVRGGDSAEARDNTPTDVESKLVAFRTASVFDISQTEGAPLPVVPVQRLVGDAPGEGVIGDLEAMAHRLGFALSIEELGASRNGVTNFVEQTIKVTRGLAPAQHVKTLVHELAHAILHAPDRGVMLSVTDCRGKAELEAESVAFIVMSTLGVDSGQYSFGYCATWAGGSDEAISAIRASGGRIQGAAHAIISALEVAGLDVSGDAGTNTAEVA